MKPEDYLTQRYEDESGEGYFAVIGYIDQPAILLRNPITGEKKTVVIGCAIHGSMRQISPEDALFLAEDRLREIEREGQ